MKNHGGSGILHCCPDTQCKVYIYIYIYTPTFTIKINHSCNINRPYMSVFGYMSVYQGSVFFCRIHPFWKSPPKRCPPFNVVGPGLVFFASRRSNNSEKRDLWNPWSVSRCSAKGLHRWMSRWKEVDGSMVIGSMGYFTYKWCILRL